MVSVYDQRVLQYQVHSLIIYFLLVEYCCMKQLLRPMGDTGFQELLRQRDCCEDSQRPSLIQLAMEVLLLAPRPSLLSFESPRHNESMAKSLMKSVTSRDEIRRLLVCPLYLSLMFCVISKCWMFTS